MAQLQLDFEWMLLALGLVGLVVLGVFVIVRCKRWQAEQHSSTAPTRIEDYRVLMEQGLLEPSEFERIRDRLEGTSGVNHTPDASARGGSGSVEPAPGPPARSASEEDNG